MRSLLMALLRFLLPPSGAHRAEEPLLEPPSIAGHRPAPPLQDVVFMDGHPLVRPYLAATERELRLQRARRRAAVLATMGQDYAVPLEAAA
ncbi:hypothetical protein [Streptomyces sp. NPDC058739]|uniref:hypothetical protein n=1 Tax=Streptomyces sp. NPDC058739 TaxID=3346618 RepID=UPI0036CC8175